MADLSDVMNALVSQCRTALYPAGYNGQAAQVSTVNSAPTKVYPGWPAESQVDTDLAAGTVNVSVFTGRVERNTTRFMDGYQQVGSTTTLAREIRRTSRQFQITVWAPDHVKRDATAIAIDLALCGLRELPLADGSQAYIRYSGGWIDDVPQKELNYQRVLIYDIEFGTYQIQSGTVVTEIVESIAPANAPVKTLTIT